jgi:hypothetical protein
MSNSSCNYEYTDDKSVIKFTCNGKNPFIIRNGEMHHLVYKNGTNEYIRVVEFVSDENDKPNLIIYKRLTPITNQTTYEYYSSSFREDQTEKMVRVSNIVGIDSSTGGIIMLRGGRGRSKSYRKSKKYSKTKSKSRTRRGGRRSRRMRRVKCKSRR